MGYYIYIFKVPKYIFMYKCISIIYIFTYLNIIYNLKYINNHLSIYHQIFMEYLVYSKH